MSEVNRQLEQALKLLSKQYEQQFEEVQEQMNELAEQIILLTDSKQSNSKNVSNLTQDLAGMLTPEQKNSPCAQCKNCMITSKGSAISAECLISSTKPFVIYCNQQDHI